MNEEAQLRVKQFEFISKLPEEERERRRKLAYPNQEDYKADQRREAYHKNQQLKKITHQNELKEGLSRRKSFLDQLHKDWMERKSNTQISNNQKNNNNGNNKIKIKAK